MRRSRIFILIGLILACATAAVIFVVLRGAAKPGTTAEVKRVDVVVAEQPVEEDQDVEGRLALKSMPEEGLPEGALRSLSATTGMLAKGPIPQGTIIQAAMLQTKQEQMQEASLGQLIEKGYVAIDLPITELSSVSYGILPDDRIDVLMTFSFVDVDQETQSLQPICPPTCPGASGSESSTGAAVQQIPRYVSQVILQDVRVLGVGRWQYQPPPPETGQETGGDAQTTTVEPPQYITVMLKAQDALVLKLAREYGASIDLAVRAANDHEAWKTDQVALDYLLTHFGFSVPPKQEYTVQGLQP